MKYHYFVSYYFTNNHSTGTGMIDVTNSPRIKSYKDLEMLTSKIAELLNIEQVVILNYQLIRKSLF